VTVAVGVELVVLAFILFVWLIGRLAGP
jgi:hypothetical protein